MASHRFVPLPGSSGKVTLLLAAILGAICRAPRGRDRDATGASAAFCGRPRSRSAAPNATALCGVTPRHCATCSSPARKSMRMRSSACSRNHLGTCARQPSPHSRASSPTSPRRRTPSLAQSPNRSVQSENCCPPSARGEVRATALPEHDKQHARATLMRAQHKHATCNKRYPWPFMHF